MKQWYEFEYETSDGIIYAYEFTEQEDQPYKLGKLIAHPPIDWMQKMLKSNAVHIRELLEENESIANLLTEHYLEKS